MSFAEGCASLIGKNIEVYCGQSKRILKYSDSETAQRAVVRGELINVIGDCLIIQCERFNPSTNETHYNKVYINTWAITALCEPDDTMSLTDMFVEEHTKQKK